VFCTKSAVLSALLGAAGSICLAVPWIADLALRVRTCRRLRRAVRDYGSGSPITTTLSELHSRQLNQPPGTGVALVGILGAVMLAMSFAIVLGAGMAECTD
jgi:hypothetical protein